MKISIIGGAGFLGTHLCRCLVTSQLDFEIIDLKLSNQYPEKSKLGDVRDINSLRENITGDVLINLAAVHRDDVKNKNEYKYTNVDGALNLVRVCMEKKINKIIFTSSVAVYGFTEFPTDENGKINPFNEYGRSKFAAEEIYRAWRKDGDHNLIIIRPTVIFGEGNRGNVFNLFHKISTRKFIMVGSGKNIKSLAYIKNVATFLKSCIKTNQKYGIYNYVDTPELTMNELVRHVRSKLIGKFDVGLRIPYWLGFFVGCLADLKSNITRKNSDLSSIRVKKFASSSHFIGSISNLDGFKPPFDLIEGINMTLEEEFISHSLDREIFFRSDKR
jgi:nucleoside-diphosphate-sugar epimerase